MFKFIKNSIYLLLIAVVFYLSIFFVLNQVRLRQWPVIYSLNTDLVIEGGNGYTRYRDYDETKKRDVIVMGSSHAYRGFDPRIFKKNGLEMFNLGSSSQSISDTEVLLKNMVDPKKVDLIIIEIFPLTFVTDGYESTAYLIANLQQDDIAWKLAKRNCGIKDVNLMTQRYMRKLANEPLYEADDYVVNGYCEKLDSVKTEINFVKNVHFNPKERDVEAFERIIKFTKDNNIKTIFVTQPMPQETDSTLFGEFSTFINAYEEKEGIDYMDYSQSLHLNSKDNFYDHSHLNQSGVEIFNKKLLQDLKERGVL